MQLASYAEMKGRKGSLIVASKLERWARLTAGKRLTVDVCKYVIVWLYLGVTCAMAQGMTYQICKIVDNAGGDIAGENYSCGQCYGNGLFGRDGCIRCETASLRIPEGQAIDSTSRTAERLDRAAWLDDINIVAQLDNSILVSTSLKNWNDKLKNKICLKVTTR